ncbi:MAG TPA: hypothetical protein VJI67_00555, partial [archaeon]|nr:hypothetical protein [archaeon]
LCPDEALYLAGGIFSFAVILGSLVIWYLWQQDKEKKEKEKQQAKYSTKQTVTGIVPEDLVKKEITAPTLESEPSVPPARALEPAETQPQKPPAPVLFPEVKKPEVSAPQVFMPPVSAPPIALQPTPAMPAQGLPTQEEMKQIEALVKALAPFTAKASREDMMNVIRDKGYSEVVALEALKRLYG